MRRTIIFGLSKKIVKLRKQLGISQEELAGRLNVSRQSVSKWELGESEPELTKIIELSNVFKVSTDFLLIDGDEKKERPVEQTVPLKPAHRYDLCMALGFVGLMITNLIIIFRPLNDVPGPMSGELTGLMAYLIGNGNVLFKLVFIVSLFLFIFGFYKVLMQEGRRKKKINS